MKIEEEGEGSGGYAKEMSPEVLATRLVLWSIAVRGSTTLPSLHGDVVIIVPLTPPDTRALS